jgi:hypothetical protein
VRLRRPAGMLPLPVPQQGGSIETLNSFLNLASRDDFVLIVAWLLAALRPNGPYPLLAISGEQGSAKTVLSKLLKALPVRSLSREERELMIAANNGYLLAFDNLSGLPIWLSDALCRLVERVVARIRNRAAPHARCPAGCGGTRFTRLGWRPLGSAAAHGRFRAMGRGLRDSPVARRHFRSGLRRKPQDRDRGHDRGRSGSGVRTETYDRAKRVDGKRRRSFTCNRSCQ